MNLTPVQLMALILVVLGAITGGTSQLTDIFGPLTTKILVSSASLFTSIISGFVLVLTGQSSMLKSVQSMPGVDKIVVNASANSTLATLAVDPNQDKIEASPQAQQAVAQTARDASK